MAPETVITADTHAYFEQVSIPAGHSFLWRIDDYPWARNVWNYHPEFEIHLIRHSSGLTYVGDHIGQFEAGHLFLVGGSLPHNWITPNIGDQLLKGRDLVLQFDPNVFRTQGVDQSELSEVTDLLDQASRGIQFMGQTAIKGRKILESMDGSGSLLDLSKMLNLLSVLANSTEKKLLASEGFMQRSRFKASKDHVLIEKALDYLQRNFLDNPSLGEVADVVNMSESAFSRFFKNKTGNTFSEHIVSLRIWMATKLLIETDMPITEICFEAGFNNISNFNRTFLKKTGLKPSNYRHVSQHRNMALEQHAFRLSQPNVG